MSPKKKPDPPNPLDEIRQALTILRLPAMVEALQAEIDAGPRPDDSRLDLLHRLLKAQLQRRRENGTARRLKDARFPASKSLDDFDSTSSPSSTRAL